MKISQDRVAYPDVSHQLTDLVTQQAEPGVAPGKLRPLSRDQYRELRAEGLTKLDLLLLRGVEPIATFGHIPRPEGWRSNPAIFYEPSNKVLLRSAAVALSLNGKLDEMLSKVAGQITDLKFAASDVKAMLPKDFRGLVFRGEPGNTQKGSTRFIRERSLHSIDELRGKLAPATGRSSMIQDASERATSLLQLRTKLGELNKLANLIDGTFSDLDAVDFGRLKTPQLC
jgi:hypothetical protein